MDNPGGMQTVTQRHVQHENSREEVNEEVRKQMRVGERHRTTVWPQLAMVAGVMCCVAVVIAGHTYVALTLLPYVDSIAGVVLLTIISLTSQALACAFIVFETPRRLVITCGRGGDTGADSCDEDSSESDSDSTDTESSQEDSDSDSSSSDSHMDSSSSDSDAFEDDQNVGQVRLVDRVALDRKASLRLLYENDDDDLRSSSPQDHLGAGQFQSVNCAMLRKHIQTLLPPPRHSIISPPPTTVDAIDATTSGPDPYLPRAFILLFHTTWCKWCPVKKRLWREIAPSLSVPVLLIDEDHYSTQCISDDIIRELPDRNAMRTLLKLDEISSFPSVRLYWVTPPGEQPLIDYIDVPEDMDRDEPGVSDTIQQWIDGVWQTTLQARKVDVEENAPDPTTDEAEPESNAEISDMAPSL